MDSANKILINILFGLMIACLAGIATETARGSTSNCNTAADTLQISLECPASTPAPASRTE